MRRRVRDEDDRLGTIRPPREFVQCHLERSRDGFRAVPAARGGEVVQEGRDLVDGGCKGKGLGQVGTILGRVISVRDDLRGRGVN